MIALLAFNPAVLLGLALVFALLVGAAIALESDRGRAQLRRFAWFRRLELLGPAELRFRGMVGLGLGICSFAALLTLRLFELVPTWLALGFGALAVALITGGAALLERAASLEG